MSEYVTLIGVEQVQSAGNRIAAAADEMRRSAGAIDDALARHQRFMDDWLSRLEAVMEANPQRHFHLSPNHNVAVQGNVMVISDTPFSPGVDAAPKPTAS